MIDIPKIKNRLGNIAVIENEVIPFDIKRVYYLYDIPSSSMRGGHSHKKLQQVLIAISGSFDVILDDGQTRRTFTLNRSYHGLYIPKLIWRSIENYSTNSISLIMASDIYNPNDYIYDWSEFINVIGKNQ